MREAPAATLPPPRKRVEGRPAPTLGPHRPLIDEWLKADREAPRQQRHTARRDELAAPEAADLALHAALLVRPA